MGPRLVDWRDALDRVRRSTVATSLAPLLDSAQVGSAVLLVCAQPGTGPLALPWFELMDVRCGQWRRALEGDTRFAAMTSTFSQVAPADESRQVLRFEKTGA